MACLAAGQVMPSVQSLPQGCMATGAQYAACITDEVAAYSTGAGTFPSCQMVTLADLSDNPEFPEAMRRQAATRSATPAPASTPRSPQEASGGSVDNYPSSSSSSSGGSSGGGSGSGSSSGGSSGGSSGSASSSSSSSGSIGPHRWEALSPATWRRQRARPSLRPTP